MGRRAQANARTLNWAVRQVFQPIYTELAPVKPAASADKLDDESQEILIPTQVESQAQPSEKSLGKRKRTESLHDDSAAAVSRQEETAHVETRYKKSNLPPALKKYWSQRYRLFSRYDEGIEMDYDGWFSVTPENIAAQIAERCRCGTVVDAFCGVGGNAIQFALTCEKVIAIDTSATRLACARANAKIYGVEENIEFIQADFVEWAKSRKDASVSQDPIDVVFMSPPWGGIDYRVEEPPSDTATDTLQTSPYSTYGLSKLAPLHGKALFELARGLSPNVAYYLPRNQDIHEAAALVSESEKIEVEEEWMGSKLKALCIYYGELATSS